MNKLTHLEGIGAKFAALLQNAGIETQDQLLLICGNYEGRQSIANETGINPKLLLKWAHQADLARIKGIGEDFAQLLEYTGINSVPDLAQYHAQQLSEALKAANQLIKLVNQLPSFSQMELWIEQARELPKRIVS